ncbi:claudin-10 isoform X2 [Anabas testudineus]|uniref:claudin-10 isoform X2 n=1 Tax=Anabas testudineus TaxID=64144 RepID=UPI000E4576FE|nr:claudin-10 isoform X2 [Anabas testudineus]
MLTSATSAMRKRLIQIFGFLISTLGWVLVLCTLAMDYWRVTQLGGQGGSFVIRVLWYWSNLWKDCSADSTAVANCRDFPTLWDVTPFIHVVRGLLMCGLIFGFVGAVLCFVGMECTYIGGADQTKDKLLLAGAVFHFAGGVSDISAYSLYISRIIRTSFGTIFSPTLLRYDIGPPIFLGLVGSVFILFGAVLYSVTVFRSFCPERWHIHGPSLQRTNNIHWILQDLQTLWIIYWFKKIQ